VDISRPTYLNNRGHEPATIVASAVCHCKQLAYANITHNGDDGNRVSSLTTTESSNTLDFIHS